MIFKTPEKDIFNILPICERLIRKADFAGSEHKALAKVESHFFFSPSGLHSIDRICDKKLNSCVVPRLKGLYL